MRERPRAGPLSRANWAGHSTSDKSFASGESNRASTSRISPVLSAPGPALRGRGRRKRCPPASAPATNDAAESARASTTDHFRVPGPLEKPDRPPAARARRGRPDLQSEANTADRFRWRRDTLDPRRPAEQLSAATRLQKRSLPLSED